MSRYIDKDKLLKKINSFISTDSEYTQYNCGYDDCICVVQDAIYDMPEADVVEVVRCKDCIFSREMNKYEKQLYLDSCIGCAKLSMSYHSVIMDKNDYCSCGKRKENGNGKNEI